MKRSGVKPTAYARTAGDSLLPVPSPPFKGILICLPKPRISILGNFGVEALLRSAVLCGNPGFRASQKRGDNRLTGLGDTVD
jgi:hypothetical protein